MAEKIKIIATIQIILERDGHLFMLRRFNTGYEDGKYDFIAGHIKAGESPKNAAIREAKEEADITISTRELKLVHTLYKAKTDWERIHLFFKVKKWAGEPKNNEPEKCDGVAWFKSDEIPENTIPFIKFALNQISQGSIFSEFGF